MSARLQSDERSLIIRPPMRWRPPWGQAARRRSQLHKTRSVVAALAALVGFSSLSPAQPFNTPTFYSWIPHPVPCNGWNGDACASMPDPYLVQMYPADCVQFGNNPEGAAFLTAQTLQADLAAGYVQPGQICILPLHFGHNHEFAPDNTLMTRYFRDEDRLSNVNDYLG